MNSPSSSNNTAAVCHHARLDNALTTLVAPIRNRRRAVLTLYLKTGSRFEEPSANGLSHFVEHLLFRGIASHPSSQQLAQAFEDLGGTLNASTAADHGNLSINVPLANLKPVIDLVAEVYCAPLLSDLDVERDIIREEILEDLNERGELVDGPTLLRGLAFPRHGLGQPITGPLTNLERFSRASVREHHERTHVGTDCVVCVSGDVDVDWAQKALASAFGKAKRGSPLLGEAPPAQQEPRFEFANYPGSSQSALHLGFRCPGHHSSQEPALEMLLRVLDDGMSTRLYRRLCDSQGLCYDASASYETYEDAGLVELEADTAHERAELVVTEMMTLVDELAQHGVESRELDRARQRVRWEYEALADDVEDVAEFFAAAQFNHGNLDPKAREQRLLDVARSDVRDVAQQVFRPETRSLVVVGSSETDSTKLRRVGLGAP